MKKIAISTKGCVQLISNDTCFADSWLCYVKNAEEMVAVGVDYCGPVKTSHKGFCLATLEKFRLAGRVISCFEEYSMISR